MRAEAETENVDVEAERRQIGFFRAIVPPELCAKWTSLSGHLETAATSVIAEDGYSGLVVDTARRDAKLINSIYQDEIRAWTKRFVVECLEPFYGIRARDWADPQFLRYDAGGGHTLHSDAETYQNSTWTRVFDRDYSLVIFLNTDFEGGGFDLPRQQLLIHPSEPGVGIAFPSGRRFPHAVLPVEKGPRYTIVSWLRAAAAS